MSSVLQLVRTLQTRPEVADVPGVFVRNFTSEEGDVPDWLLLREQAFARERVGVRRWSVEDFRREFLDKSWWLPERMWLAESAGRLVGSVSLAMRGSGYDATPAVHWLMVHPRMRRHGVGRLLLQTLEAYAFDTGHTEICLETHTAWAGALRLYESLGYRRP